MGSQADSVALARPSARSLLDSPLLPWSLVALGAVSAFARPLAEALAVLTLPDTDDAMRLAQVRDLVAGQSWFDPVQHRFLPPAGVASHWSRLVDAPLAAGIAALSPLVGAGAAERVVTALWPPLLFAVFALVLIRGTTPLFGQRAAVLALFAALQTLGLSLQFAPGRIDHHNVQLVLMLGLGLSLMRPQAVRWRDDAWTGTVAGGCSALSLAVGLEALPLVALAGLLVVADWVRRGRPALCGFGLSLGLGATALYGLQTAPSLWGETACDALSPPWLWLAGTGTALAVAAAFVAPSRSAARLTLAGGIGALGLAGFALLAPACLQGPFAGMPESVRAGWLERVHEMSPLWSLLRERPAEALGFSAVLLVATLAAVVLAWREPRHRRAFCVAALFLATGGAMTVLRMRGIYVASAFVPPVAGYCLDRALTVSGPDVVGPRARFAFLATALALNAQAWFAAGLGIERVAGFAQQDMAKGRVEGTAAGTAKPAGSGCARAADLAPLDALSPGTVLAPIDLGPYLLVHTRHAIVAAPYHRAIPGLTAGLALVDGDETALRTQAGSTGATYLALCPAENETAPGPNGAEPSFAARLGRGQAEASWLEPFALPGSGLKVWRLR